VSDLAELQGNLREGCGAMAETTTLDERVSNEVAQGHVHEVAAAAQPDQPLGRAAAVARDSAPVAFVLIAVVVMVGVVTWLGPILQPFLVAVFLYFSTKAIASFLTRRGFPTLLAYLTLLVVGSMAVTAIALLAYGEALAFRVEWPRYQERILALIGSVPTKASQPLSQLFTTSSGEVLKYVFERGVGLLEVLAMTFFYLLFIVFEANRLPRRVLRAFPDGRGERIVAVAGKIGTGMERFMEVKTAVSIGLGLSSAVLMYLFGLRSSLLWGLLFFALNYISYIGSIVACVPPLVLAYLDLQSPMAATALAVVVILNRFIWIDYLEVKVAGRHLSIDSILLFLWLAYWGWVWGVIGLILAFPMVTSLKIVLEQLESTKSWAVLMSDD
jgi:predicted PurR-regulated permease PerM